MDYYYKQPKFFSQFSCIGGDCSLSCCKGWSVLWYEKEYEYLKSADMSDALRSKIHNSFKKVNSELYEINLCDDDECPFHHRDTGLCDIQKEIGEKYFGVTCASYPRHYFKKMNIIFRSCSSTCPNTIRLLIYNEDAMKMEMIRSRDYKTIDPSIVKSDSETSVKKSPYLKYRFDILDFYIDLFLRRINIKNAMVIGALAARKISDAANNRSEGNIPKIMKDYKKLLGSADTMRSIDKITPDYRVKFKIVNNLIFNFFGTEKNDIDISILHDGEKLVSERYFTGWNNFNNAIKNIDTGLKNIIANMFIDIFMFLNFTEHSFFDFYSYFTVCVAVLEVFACAIGYKSNSIEKSFINVASVLNRAISHNLSRSEAILEDLKKEGLVSPAHLAFIIK